MKGQCKARYIGTESYWNHKAMVGVVQIFVQSLYYGVYGCWQLEPIGQGPWDGLETHCLKYAFVLSCFDILTIKREYLGRGWKNITAVGKHALSLRILMWSPGEEVGNSSCLGLCLTDNQVPGTQREELKEAEPQTFKGKPSDRGIAWPWWVLRVCNP